MEIITAMLAVLFSVSACASSGEGWGPFTHAAKMGVNNGKQSWAITCKSNGVGYCYQRAGKVCPRGFNEIGSKDHSTGALASQGLFVASSDVVLKVQCK